MKNDIHFKISMYFLSNIIRFNESSDFIGKYCLLCWMRLELFLLFNFNEMCQVKPDY